MDVKSVVYVTIDIQGALLCFLAAVCLCIAADWRGKRRFALVMMEIINALIAIGDAIAWGFRGAQGRMAGYFVRFGNLLNFVAAYVVILVFLDYVLYSIEQGLGEREMFRMAGYGGNGRFKGPSDMIDGFDRDSRIIKNLLFSLVGINLILLFLSQFTGWIYYFDEHNYYHRGPWYPVISAIGIAELALLLYLVLKWRRTLTTHRLSALICYIVLPFISVIVQSFIYGFSISNIVSIICAIFLFAEAFIEQSVRIREDEKFIKESQMKIALSQIKPHFLFNVLSSIYYLVGMDSDKCREAISGFSRYLRGNISSIYSGSPIPLEQELSHTRAYLELEEMRFPERLRVRYEIKEKDFMIPALTIQPLAENAVRHGIMKKEGGGTLTIGTDRDKDCYIVTISDDGAGFDEGNKMDLNDDTEEHIGLSNVKKRLELMQNATLSVSSEAGRGTIITIRIPDDNRKERSVNEFRK